MRRKMVGMTVDTLDDMLFFTFTEEKIRRLLELFRREGFERIFWYDYVAHTGLFRDMGLMRRMLDSLPLVPNHTEIAVREGRKLGLEMYVTYKPYEEGGFGITFPPGSEMDLKYGKLERLGGRDVACTDWLLKHADKRVRRRMDDIPADINERVISKVEFDKNDDVPSGLKKSDIKLYVSQDNAGYSEYTGKWTFKEETVPALLLDYFGIQINGDTRKTRRLTISGLRLGPEWKYLVITAGEKMGQFKCIPMTMCRVYDVEGRQIPVTFAINYNERKLDGLTRTEGLSGGGFVKDGFDFDSLGYAMGCCNPYYTTSHRPLLIAVTRGVNEYLAGVPCEAYPEVRRHWLEEVRRLLSYKPDGIELRVPAHSNDTQDPFAYGFNEPVLAAYRKMMKSDDVAFDPVRIMRIRGEFFTRFLSVAAAEIRASGVKVQAQVFAAYARGNIQALANRSFMGIWPDWEEWVSRHVDAVAFRDFLAEFYNPDFDRVIKPFARSLNREVWVPAYCEMSCVNVNDTYLKAVEADDDVTGVMFYESAGMYEERNGKFVFKPSFLGPFRRFMKRNK